jgi:hypothetical protein
MRSTVRAILLSSVALLCSAVGVAQSSPKYDSATEAKFQGTIAELRIPEKGAEKQIAHLTVKSGTDTWDLYLCPKYFMDDMGISFAKGDEISFTGSKVKEGDADMILTRELIKGTDTLVFRDEKGKPVWIWKK